MNHKYLWLLAGVLLIPLVAMPLAYSQSTCFPAPDGLIGWWPADGDADDVEGGNHGTPIAGTTFGTGLVGQAFLLDGVDDYVLIGPSPTLDSMTGAGAQMTVDAWIKAGSTDTSANNGLGDHIVRKGNETNDLNFSYDVELRSDGGVNRIFAFYCRNGATFCGGGSTQRFQVKSDTGIPDTDWHHVAVIFDTTTTVPSENIRIFIDGAESSHTTTTGSPQSGINVTSTTSIGIGATAAGTASFFGLIDEVELFNRALSPAEILAIYDAGSAGKCKDEDNDGFRPPDDCDETDAGINPDGLELPGNFVDENCDGDLGDCSPCNTWRNHGEYIRCTSQAVSLLVSGGALTEEEGDALVSSAARSDVGKKSFVPPPECTP